MKSLPKNEMTSKIKPENIVAETGSFTVFDCGIKGKVEEDYEAFKWLAEELDVLPSFLSKSADPVGEGQVATLMEKGVCRVRHFGVRPKGSEGILAIPVPNLTGLGAMDHLTFKAAAIKARLDGNVEGENRQAAEELLRTLQEVIGEMDENEGGFPEQEVRDQLESEGKATLSNVPKSFRDESMYFLNEGYSVNADPLDNGNYNVTIEG